MSFGMRMTNMEKNRTTGAFKKDSKSVSNSQESLTKSM